MITHHWVGEAEGNTVAEGQENSGKKGCQVLASLEDSQNDFPYKCHQLAKYFGLSSFVVISPSGNEMLTTEDRINLILSSITIAVNNIQRYEEDFFP